MAIEPFGLPDPFKDLETWSRAHPVVTKAHYYLKEIDVDFDVDGQLGAIRQLINRNRGAEAELSKEYQRIAEDPSFNGDYVGDCLEGLAYESVFQDAAHSMAAVGMLAPFLETVFFQCFRGIGKHWLNGQNPVSGHDRWQATQTLMWDCHNVISKGRCRTDLVRGILQLADEIGLRSKLPTDIEPILTSLFAYRNKMFHFGFEWPLEERIAFQKRIEEEKWPPAWFSRATSADEPWIFYMSDEFIDLCLEATNQVLTAFGEFVRDGLHLGGATDSGKEDTNVQ